MERELKWTIIVHSSGPDACVTHVSIRQIKLMVLSLLLCLRVHLHISLSVCPSTCWSVCPSTCWSVCWSVYHSVGLFISLFVCLSVWFFVCLFVRLRLFYFLRTQWPRRLLLLQIAHCLHRVPPEAHVA